MGLISEFLTQFFTKDLYGKLSKSAAFPALSDLCQMLPKEDDSTLELPFSQLQRESCLEKISWDKSFSSWEHRIQQNSMDYALIH